MKANESADNMILFFNATYEQSKRNERNILQDQNAQTQKLRFFKQNKLIKHQTRFSQPQKVQKSWSIKYFSKTEGGPEGDVQAQNAFDFLGK